MTLITSISGIRGTIGGIPGEGLTPLDIVRFTTAFAEFISREHPGRRLKVVIGRDARVSGPMVSHLVTGTLMGKGVDVIDTGLSTTPTVEMMVTHFSAQGGIIITASHNPGEWNALKLLNHKGEFLSAAAGQKILELSASPGNIYSEVQQLGSYSFFQDAIDLHITKILELPLVDVEAIRSARITVAVDAVNSTGGISVLPLLERLGVQNIIPLYCDPTGHFPHNPEPLPANLSEIAALVQKEKADLGFVVDPDVDRLAIITEKGEMFGEEYTLVAVADYILKNKAGNTVSNLSSTRALQDVTEKYGGKYFASAVGEVNVVEMMKKKNAVIGGEGNGGVIYPDLHYGRDALAGIALFLTHLVKSGLKCSEIRSLYPDYYISKNKIELKPDVDVDGILENISERYADFPLNKADGVRIDFPEGWVHLRKSNTEPIIRIYSESRNEETAGVLAGKLLKDINNLM